MSSQTKFYFTGKDNTSQAFKNIQKSMKQVAKQTVVVTTALKAMGKAVSAVSSLVKGVLSTALKGIVTLVRTALETIKKLVTGAFKFIKTALSTLLSWITKALGKVFNIVTSTLKGIINGMVNITKTAINTAKKVIDTIVQSVKDYAAKEYNEIQLRVSLGDSFDAVMKDFKELLRYTTADKNDLLSVFATYSEIGKSPSEIAKYARATVYLSNATGKSFQEITQMLLGQEQVTGQIEKTLRQYGVNISVAKADLTDVEKIISRMDEEMQALASQSLSQLFANVKNDLITIREQVGALFSGPVKYVSQKIDDLLRRIIGSNKIENLSSSINKLFDKIKPTIDKIFEFFEKFIQDPEGFFKALWQDIQQIFSNIWKNLDKYASILGYIFGQAIITITDAIHSIDWGSVSTVFDNLASALKSFTMNVGVSLNWWTQEDIDKAEGSIVKLLMNAWNKAHPDFELSSEDKWYENLWTLIKAAWELALKPFWDDTLKPIFISAWDWIKDTWTNTVLPVLKTTFEWLGEVIASSFTNLVLHSDVLKKIMSALGTPMVSGSDRDKIYGLLSGKGFLGDMSLDEFRNLDLNSKSGTGYATWAEMIDIWGKSSFFTEEEGDLIRRLGRAGEVVEEQVIPSFSDLFDRIHNTLNPEVEELGLSMGPLVDALKNFREIDSYYNPWHYKGFSVESTGAGVGGSGGIMDYFSTSGEFKIKPYAKGGLVTNPTLALIGEEGPEAVVPLDNQQGGFDWSNPIASAKLALGISEDLSVISKNTSFLFKWYQDTPTLGEAGEDAVDEAEEKSIPWYKKIWNATKSVVKGISSYVGGTAKILANNGAFGTHIGNIMSGIQSRMDDGTLSLWTALGEIIKEFLPYLQKGLEVVGKLFDEAFEIAGNAVQILGERIGNMLLPLLEAFIPLMKTISDVVIALSPVIESVLAPAIKIIALILNIITGLLDKLMPIIAAFSAVIQWVSDAISYAIGSFINWLASWIPWIQSTSVTKPKHVGDYYFDIMDTYNAQKANGVTGITSSTATAAQTVSYSGATQIKVENYFSDNYIVGEGGMKDLAIIIRNTIDDLGYSRQIV